MVHTCDPLCPLAAAAAAATVPKDVPEATWDSAASASDSLEYAATVKQSLSNSAGWLAKYRCKSDSDEPTPDRSSSRRVRVASNLTLVSMNDFGMEASTSVAVTGEPAEVQPNFEPLTWDRTWFICAF